MWMISHSLFFAQSSPRKLRGAEEITQSSRIGGGKTVDSSATLVTCDPEMDSSAQACQCTVMFGNEPEPETPFRGRHGGKFSARVFLKIEKVMDLLCARGRAGVKVNLMGDISLGYEYTWHQVGAKMTPNTIGFGRRLEIVRVIWKNPLSAVGVTAEWGPQGISHGIDERAKSRRHCQIRVLRPKDKLIKKVIIYLSTTSELSSAPTPPRRLAFNKRKQHSHNLDECFLPDPIPLKNIGQGSQHALNGFWTLGTNFGEGHISVGKV
ncbi:hypothetical protein DFH07DRAFT_777560 [Mycena maculata]|uniref:Uncharacterized protein n=1 Tax=Mycena maculata TaxID=230809 RepID=A0AAD7N2J0_9AGAR|nr:hypothetical protein DFH07DRAFT_777560 [Mycena maculata]